MAQNYNREMEKIIAEIKKSGAKPKLLLHSCCAPCSSSVLERLTPYFDVTVYYYNPNLDSAEEFELRAAEQCRLCSQTGVEVVVEPYDAQEFLSAVIGHEDDAEGGARCAICFALRLNKTANVAKEKGFDYWTTTLTVSPLKNAERLNEIGNAIAQKVGCKWLSSDFKKKGGYLRSTELSRQYELYRQNYCGCVFSKRGRPV